MQKAGESAAGPKFKFLDGKIQSKAHNEMESKFNVNRSCFEGKFRERSSDRRCY